LKLARELSAKRFDLAVLLPNSLDAALITWLARIPRRIGYATDGRAMFLSHPVPVSVRPLASHQTAYYVTMLEYYGISAKAKPQLLETTGVEDAQVYGLLAAAAATAADVIIGINPGATYGSAKRWYPDRFAAVADELAGRWGAKIVITGSRDEAAIAEEIAVLLKNPHVNLAGKTTVRELMAVIKRCSIFITNDSGPMHIAAAFGVPVVAVFGSTDNTTTYPLSAGAVVVRKQVDCAPCMKRVCPTDHRCMQAVGVADVIAAAEQLQESVLQRVGR
jgi:heptosyltransferase-2